MMRTHTIEAGFALTEILSAIFAMGIGLLALLTIFPLGALDMAQAISDDRTASIAADAVALSDAGKELLSQTEEFIERSLSNGEVDPAAAQRLHNDFADFTVWAAEVEVELEKLKTALPPEQIQRHVGPLLGQIRAIRQRTHTMSVLLSLLR